MLNTPDRRLALQAYGQILDLILSGAAAPGSLVNERRLADTLQMSRTPVRDALLMLEGEGFLVRQDARGLQVRQMRVAEVLDALQIRLHLEPEAARIAAGRIPPAELAALRPRLEVLARGAAGGEVDRDEVRAVDDRLHGLIADAVGKAQMAAIIRTLRRHTRIFDRKSLPERRQHTCREHLAILDVLGDGVGPGAAEGRRAHLLAVRQSILARLVRP